MCNRYILDEFLHNECMINADRYAIVAKPGCPKFNFWVYRELTLKKMGQRQFEKHFSSSYFAKS